jgi:hypothetical protein
MKESEAVDAALHAVKRNDDGGADEKAVIDECMRFIDFDAEQELRNKATRAVRRRRSPRATDPDGRICLPGMETYGYEPGRLIADNDGHVVEQDKARPEYKRAEAQRAREVARRQAVWAERKTAENEAYAAWALEQLTRRRKGKEITFGTFVRESGLWSAEPAEPESDEDVAA